MNKNDRYNNIANVLAILIMSNTMYFGILHRKLTFLTFLLVGLLTFLRKNKISTVNIFRFFVITLMLMLGMVVNMKILDGQYIKTIIEQLIILFVVAILTSNIKKENFIRIYINTIVIFCIISLVCNIIANFIPQYASLFYQSIYKNDVNFLVSPFYMWGRGSVWTRNSGPYWEPGAFQGFINIALLWLINSKTKGEKYYSKVIILIITLLTTQSTTGYIIGIINLIFFQRKILKDKDKNNNIIKLSIILLCFVSLLVIYKSNNITDKFKGKNESYEIRVGDQKGGINLVKEKPLLGFGAGGFKDINEAKESIHNNSNGVILLMYMYGIPLAIIYGIMSVMGIRKNFCELRKLEMFIILIEFLILHISEGLIWLPFYLIFIYEWDNVKTVRENWRWNYEPKDMYI